jgi:hypothetical protein
MSHPEQGLTDELGFDPEALRERYRRERDKRLRADGIDQYREARGELARFVEVDPLAGREATRDPVDEDVDVVIVGGGFSGLLAAARLAERGVTTFRIVEAGADFGGTWYWNRYPGRPVRHRRLLLPASARRARLHAEGEVRLRRRDLRALAAHRPSLRAV